LAVLRHNEIRRGILIAIVTRKLSIPALMGTRIETSADLDQRRVTIHPTDDPDGLLLLSDDD
jgi:hypothetical protein